MEHTHVTGDEISYDIKLIDGTFTREIILGVLKSDLQKNDPHQEGAQTNQLSGAAQVHPHVDVITFILTNILI